MSKPGLRVYTQGRRDPPGARRPRRRRPVHQPGAHDRPRGAQASHGRRSPLLRLVRRPQCLASATHPSPSRAASTSPSPARTSRSRARRARSSVTSRARSRSARTSGVLVVERPDDERQNRALHGLIRSLVNNMVVGVTEGFRKDLDIVGVGYRATAKGADQARARARLQPPGRRSRPPTASTFEVAQPDHASIVRGHRQGSSSARSPPTSARSASRSPTRARASGTPTSTWSARPARPGSREDERQREAEARRPHPAPPPRAQEGRAAPPSVPAWPCSGPTGTSAPR